jgi:peroxiredoxin Q/BCP
MPDLLQEGGTAPDFALEAYGPKGAVGKVSLKHYRPKAVVLYFYPTDDTPGCTIEACEFGKQHPSFEKLDAVVLGVSPDDMKSHEKFSKKFDLPFLLLADEGHAVADSYGVWGEKQNFGKTYMGVIRSTFLIDGKGKIARIWRKVKAEGHAEAVLAAIKELEL